MGTVNVLGVRHTYDLTATTAAPYVLVFVHGWLLSRQYWRPLIQQLAPDYQCLSYDLRGFGDSQPVHSTRYIRRRGINLLSQESETDIGNLSAVEEIKSRPCTPAAYAEDLGVLLQQLNISQAWLIGHSLGGTVALWAALQMPQCVQGVICINSGGGIYLKEAFERFRAAGQQLVKHRPRWLCYLPGVDLLFTRANVARPVARSWGRQRLIDFVIAHPEAALGALLESTTEEEVHRLPLVVAQLKQPVYFIAGAKDTVMDPKYVRHLASFHPLFKACGDNVLEIPDCGHLSMVEKPETVSAQIRTILASHEQG